MLPSLLLGQSTHTDLVQILKAHRRLVVSGVSNETAKSLVLSKILHDTPQKTLLVTEDDNYAEGLVHWLNFFDITAVHIPPIQVDNEVSGDAYTKTVAYMFDEKPIVYVVSKNVYEEPIFSLHELKKNAIQLAVGNTIAFTAFVEQLLHIGYTHGKDLYLSPGEYRRAGDVLDIFPIQHTHPFRIVFSFDEIEKIYAVDAINLSKTTEHTGDLLLLPCSFTPNSTLKDQLPLNSLLVLDDQDDITTPLTHSTIRFTAFPESKEHHVHLRYLSILKFYTLTDFLNDIRDKLLQDWSLTIVSKRSKELEQIFTEERIGFTTESERILRSITVINAEEDAILPHSLQNPDLKIALITDREIFSLKKANKNRSVQKLALDFITSLIPGDYVVHMEHGVAHFAGMTEKEIDNTAREYLELTYAEGDKLFVPVDQADKLSKYVVDEDRVPTLTRLGTGEWKKTMSKVKEETQKLAKELLGLYAMRAKSTGFMYGDDTKEQQEFESSFPYQETPGQIKAIEDIKRDMESKHPMDRLVCGDVGFGKTEVAMRAAFKAAMGGKQVAVVAPITILAQQHYQNFTKRMAGFAVNIAMMSRFQTAQEQKETLKKLQKGTVQIVIGTHRLIQEDVQFANLGLVIIDEEQRFGVKQKERFKEMRASVDILTLTATPIPRTLNLGLHKLRDISTITTPPPGRLPIITEVRKFSDALVRQAILAEKARDGQVFVLYNKVESIDAFTDKLRALVPEATFVVGHGQLSPDTLEERIGSFKDGKYDVLVSSTIIENGIDLPRANTLIVNEAERFGLSQLYQLRGRVGRGSLQAYAYFLYHTQKLKDDAKKRLRAIVEACELGSGFQVAMRDLEIRGAGEVLGASQSGNMQTIGVSHYLRLLKTAMDELQSGSTALEDDISTEILLPIEALIPSYYITDQQEKISVYQKLASSDTIAMLNDFADDLVREYGDLPVAVQNLFLVLHLKMAARKAGILRIKLEHNLEDEITLSLAPRVTAKEIMNIFTVSTQWKISGSTLRIRHNELCKNGAQPAYWVPELQRHIEALIPQKKQKATKAKDSDA
jgi:transcription-repair coupling factor